MALAVFIAELVPQFDLVMGIIGGTLTGPLIFILPPLFYRRLIHLEKEHDANANDSYESSSSRFAMSQSQENLTANQNPHSSNDYGTFIKGTNHFMRQHKWLLCFRNESCVCIVVIIFGVIATITSTFFNFMTAITEGDFRSPCIQNISWSFDEL